jgi:hypothetical protein
MSNHWNLTHVKISDFLATGQLSKGSALCAIHPLVLAKEVFGSNLILDRKKARGSCVKSWSLFALNSSSQLVERVKGIEPSS